MVSVQPRNTLPKKNAAARLSGPRNGFRSKHLRRRFHPALLPEVIRRYGDPCQTLTERPRMSDTTARIRKTKKQIFAAVAAIPLTIPNPSPAAIKAMIKNMSVQPSISNSPVQVVKVNQHCTRQLLRGEHSVDCDAGQGNAFAVPDRLQLLSRRPISVRHSFVPLCPDQHFSCFCHAARQVQTSNVCWKFLRRSGCRRLPLAQVFGLSATVLELQRSDLSAFRGRNG